MKMVNRLISITEGDITIDGTSVNTLEKTELRRGMGYVIQQIGLFPHMTIVENVATVPRLLRWDKQRTRARGRELLELVGWTRTSTASATRRSCPAASASASAWRARWRRTRR
jgi:osmoprotectant transport system ATP-binding protein